MKTTKSKPGFFCRIFWLGVVQFVPTHFHSKLATWIIPTLVEFPCQSFQYSSINELWKLENFPGESFQVRYINTWNKGLFISPWMAKEVRSVWQGAPDILHYSYNLIINPPREGSELFKASLLLHPPSTVHKPLGWSVGNRNAHS